jgi:hypothetical protein
MHLPLSHVLIYSILLRGSNSAHDQNRFDLLCRLRTDRLDQPWRSSILIAALDKPPVAPEVDLASRTFFALLIITGCDGDQWTGSGGVAVGEVTQCKIKQNKITLASGFAYPRQSEYTHRTRDAPEAFNLTNDHCNARRWSIL